MLYAIILSGFLNILLVFTIITKSKNNSEYDNIEKANLEELKRKNRDFEIEKNLIEKNNNDLSNENDYLKNRNITLEKDNAVLKSEKINLEKELSERSDYNDLIIRINDYKIQILNLKEELEKRKDYDNLKLKNIDQSRHILNLEKELERKQDYDKIKGDNSTYKEKIEQQKIEIEKIKIDMETNFKNLANEIIKQQKTDFTEEQNNIFKPFKEQIVELKNKIEENNKISNDNKTRFEEQMKFFGTKSDSLTKQAQDLTEALKGNKKIQGNWGEFQLDNLLQMNGFTEGIDYTKQELVMEGKRPDVIINLPDNKRIIVDSKVSLNNYYSFISCEDEKKKQDYLKEYVNDIKNHIKELADKEYNKKIKENLSLDYVLMFVPLERGYVDAIDSDESIYKYSFEHRVSIVTPSSLIPILMTIGNMWSVEKQNKNIEEIIKQAENLCKKIFGFEESMNKVESGLNTASIYFKEAKGRLLEGSANVKKTAEKIVELGGIKIIEKKQGKKRTKKISYDENDENIIEGDIVSDGELVESDE